MGITRLVINFESVFINALHYFQVKELEDFYMTNSISRASPTMAKCVTAVKAERAKKYFSS